MKEIRMISLWGYMGSGKSTVGRAFADMFLWEHLDCDEQIETEQGCKITQLFEKHGEDFFRDLETAYLRRLTDHGKKVEGQIIVTTGGGMPMREENRSLLKELGPSFFLYLPFEQIVQRLQADQHRPLWNPQQLEMMKERYEQRLPVYQQADYILSIEQQTPEEICLEIAGRLK